MENEVEETDDDCMHEESECGICNDCGETVSQKFEYETNEDR